MGDRRDTTAPRHCGKCGAAPSGPARLASPRTRDGPRSGRSGARRPCDAAVAASDGGIALPYGIVTLAVSVAPAYGFHVSMTAYQKPGVGLARVQVSTLPLPNSAHTALSRFGVP